MSPRPTASHEPPPTSSRYGTRLWFEDGWWTVRQVVYDPDWRAYLSIDSDAGEHAEIAADGSSGAYQLLEWEAGQPAPAAGRDSESGRRLSLLSQPEGARRSWNQSTADLAETLASSPAPIADRFSPRPWRP